MLSRPAFLLAGIFLAASPVRADAPGVVATINPIHSLAAAVMEGVGTPRLLLKGAASPHAYSLRPSEARMLQEAKVIFWVGPNVETFLEKPLKTLGSRAKVVALEHAPGVTRLPVREGGLWEAHDHGDDDHDHDHDDHDHDKPGHGDHDDEVDGHVWLDPRNAAAMVTAMAATLAEVDPANAARYRANAAATKAKLTALEARIRGRLGPVRGKRYIVFHDAYQYFERRYGLSPAGSVTVSPERAPGPRRLYDIRKRILDRNVVCVFAEPQFPPRLVQTVISGTPAKMGVLDPVGADLTPGVGAYAQLQNNLAAALVGCLARR